MTIQLRQICLVAHKLEPVIQDLTNILGLERCYVDPGVGAFGLENTLLPIGRNFLEVVAPLREGTAGGRYLDRRGGDGGYMVITQADTFANQQAVRTRALESEVRVAYEAQRDGWNLCQLHPGDMIAAFLEVEWDKHQDLTGHWMPVGGNGWEDKVRQDVTVDIIGVELQGPEPMALADLWARVLGLPLVSNDGKLAIALNNATLRFVGTSDNRGPGLGGLDLAVRDRGHILSKARERGCYVTEDRVDICGTRFNLFEAG